MCSTLCRARRGPWAEWDRLAEADVRPPVFGPELIKDLPGPARRWLAHVIAPGTPLWGTAVVTMRGQIRIGAWRRFTAHQVITVPEGYIWAATARMMGLPVTGFDRLSSGTGQMSWRLLGLVRVMTADGPGITRSTAGRLVADRPGADGLPRRHLDRGRAPGQHSRSLPGRRRNRARGPAGGPGRTAA